MPPCTGGIHRRSHQRVSERWGGVWGWRRQDSELQPASSYQKQSESESVVSTAKRVQESGTHGLSSAARECHEGSEIRPLREGHLLPVEGRVTESSGK